MKELWAWFCTGKTQRYIPLHKLVCRLRPKHTSLPLYHAIIGGKKTYCKAWGKCDELTTAPQLVSFCSSKDDIANIFHLIERFVVLLYDSTSTSIVSMNAEKSFFQNVNFIVKFHRNLLGLIEKVQFLPPGFM